MRKPKKPPVPSWASTPVLARTMSEQQSKDAEEIFGDIPRINLSGILRS
jgi:hypothetical protein